MGNSKNNPRITGEYWKIAKDRESQKCVFCDLRDKYVVVNNKHAALTVNIFPYIDGQLLVVPQRHVERLEELTSDEVAAVHELTKSGIDLLKKVLEIANVWIILRDGETSGKTVRHLHTNIMPYKEGINTWHYQKITIPPIDLASRLRESLKNEGT